MRYPTYSFARSILRGVSALSVAAFLASGAYAEDAKAPVAPPAADYVAARINGQEVKKSEIDALLAIAFPGEEKPDFATLDPALQENVAQNIAIERTILDEVKKSGFESDPTLVKRLEFMNRQLTVKTYLEHKTAGLVTDAQLQEEYTKRVGAGDKEEVRARHILVETEGEAKKIAERLKKGESFEKLAKEKSKDKGAAASGGDLGYFTKDKMVPAFADAAFALKKGETSKPVKSDFGWHIIRVEDHRKVAPPTFEQMKQSLAFELRGKAEEAYIKNLLQSAKVEVLDKDGKPVSPAQAPAAGGPAMSPMPPKEK